MPEHTCPYAAALSDDESSLQDNNNNSNEQSPSLSLSLLSIAKLKCPAFAVKNNSNTNSTVKCPFRECDVINNPESLREIMKTVPPSHFPGGGGGYGKGDGSGEGLSQNSSSNSAAVTPFQLAMEHVHNVSSFLEHHATDANNNNSSQTVAVANDGEKNTSTNDWHEKNKRDSFIIKGGCPFKSYHRERSNNNDNNGGGSGNSCSAKKRRTDNLARAMEDFSLAAIMGRMAAEQFDNDDNIMEGEEGEGSLGGKVEGEELIRLLSFSPTNKKDQGERGGIVGGAHVDEKNDDEVEENLSSSGDNASSSTTTTTTPQEKKQRSTSLLSQALKSGTAVSHTAAENVHFVNNFIQGKIDRELYKELICGLYHTYVTLEGLLNEFAPTYFPTIHFPKELSRTITLEEDMEYWHGLNWKDKRECNVPSPAVQDYINRMKEVGRLDPLLLLSHAYTRYLGDLSGGKVLSRIARRALNLDKRGYDGLQFYNFEHVKSAKLFKDKYRLALDELVLTPNEIGKLVAEANVAFALNMRVFEELDVKGGLEGARVRNVREALSYYDIEMEHQQRQERRGDGISSVTVLGEDGEEEKCPFGFKGGPNPHKNKGVVASPVVPSSDVAVKQQGHEKEGRCPWPFVFFHDPAMGMKDWQTWFVIGLVLCWCWSQIKV